MSFYFFRQFQLFLTVLQVGDQGGKSKDDQECSDPKPSKTFPNTCFAIKDDASIRNSAFWNVPALQFIPVKHQHAWKDLNRNIFGSFPLKELENDPGRDLSLFLKIHQITADDAMSQVRVRHPKYRGVGSRRDHGKCLRCIEEFVPSGILEEGGIKNDGVRR